MKRYRKALDNNQEAMRGEATDEDDNYDYSVDDSDDNDDDGTNPWLINVEDLFDMYHMDDYDDDGCNNSPNVCPGMNDDDDYL